MGSLLVVAAVAGVVFLWVRGARRNRERWLARLDLPGSWAWEGHDGILEFGGALSEGPYRLKEAELEEQGTWRLTGHELELESASGGVRRFDLVVELLPACARHVVEVSQARDPRHQDQPPETRVGHQQIARQRAVAHHRAIVRELLVKLERHRGG